MAELNVSSGGVEAGQGQNSRRNPSATAPSQPPIVPNRRPQSNGAKTGLSAEAFVSRRRRSAREPTALAAGASEKDLRLWGFEAVREGGDSLAVLFVCSRGLRSPDEPARGAANLKLNDR